jgi:hypothetical protein
MQSMDTGSVTIAVTFWPGIKEVQPSAATPNAQTKAQTPFSHAIASAKSTAPVTLLPYVKILSAVSVNKLIYWEGT